MKIILTLLIIRFKFLNATYLIHSNINKMSLQVLKKEILRIYNMEKQIYLNDFKKTRKLKKKWEVIGHLLQ